MRKKNDSSGPSAVLIVNVFSIEYKYVLYSNNDTRAHSLLVPLMVGNSIPLVDRRITDHKGLNIKV